MLVFRKTRGAILLFLISLVVCPLLPALGQNAVHKFTQTERARVGGLADALNAQNSIVRLILTQLGFPPQNAPETWRRWQGWPNVRMLEAAYVSAEAARPGGGQILLAKVARLVAANHSEAIRDEPSLETFFPEPKGTPIAESVERLPFAVPSPAEIKSPLPLQARNIIKICTRYTEDVYRPWLFARCCNLTEDQSYDIMRDSPDDPAAFEAAILLKNPPPSNDEKISRMIEAVHADNPTIEYEPALAERFHPAVLKLHEVELRAADDQVSKGIQGFITPILTAGTKTSPAPPAPGPGVEIPGPVGSAAGFGTPRREVTESTYRVFESSRYPTTGGGGWSFRRMAGRVFGFGGVIFGNEVTAPPDISSPVEVRWLRAPDGSAPTSPDVQEAWGRLIFKLKDGSTVFSHLVRADTAVAARAIAFSRSQTKSDVGFGLIGYLRGFQYAKLSKSGTLDVIGTGFSYVVHPDVAATRLGRSMMLLDTLPMISDSFITQVADSGVSATEVAQLRSIMSADLGQYKFTDVGLQVHRIGDGEIGVSRMSDGTNANGFLRDHAYITLLSFKGDNARPEAAFPFYALVPTLIRVSDPFARANEFAEIFALLRWAQGHGAVWSGDVPSAPDLPVSTAVAVGNDRSFTFGPSAEAFAQALITEVGTRASALASQSKNNELIDTTTKVQRELEDLVSSIGALSIAGSASEFLGATFSANATLTQKYPEISAKALLASSFRQGSIKTAVKEIRAEDWINAHIDALEIVVPGVKARKQLADHINLVAASLEDDLGNPIYLFNKITKNAYKAEFVKAEKSLAESQTETEKNRIADEVSYIIEEAVPGYTDWFNIETSLYNIILS
jgi:hypothetical protein